MDDHVYVPGQQMQIREQASCGRRRSQGSTAPPPIDEACATAGHSLRGRLATSAAIAGVEERAIMAQTRHRSVAVARRYLRDGSLFCEDAVAAVGL
jgi:hypothetical protein